MVPSPASSLSLLLPPLLPLLPPLLLLFPLISRSIAAPCIMYHVLCPHPHAGRPSQAISNSTCIEVWTVLFGKQNSWIRQAAPASRY